MDAQVCELESQLQTERSTNKALRAFLDQGRVERDNMYRDKERLEQVIASLRDETTRLTTELHRQLTDKENERVPQQPKEIHIKPEIFEALREAERRGRQAESKNQNLASELETARTRVRLADAELGSMSEKFRLIATEKESLAVQVKTQRRLINEMKQKIFHLEISSQQIVDKKAQSQLLVENASLKNKISELTAQLMVERETGQARDRELTAAETWKWESRNLGEKILAMEIDQKNKDERMFDLAAKAEQAKWQIAEIITSHDFEIQLKDQCTRKLQDEISDLTQRLCRFKHKDLRDVFIQTVPAVSDQQVQVEDSHTVYRKLQISMKKLKNYLCCFACRRTGAGLLALVPCGHLVCPGCHDDALRDDALLLGVRCGVCRGISDYAIPSGSAGKLLELLTAIDKELKC